MKVSSIFMFILALCSLKLHASTFELNKPNVEKPDTNWFTYSYQQFESLSKEGQALVSEKLKDAETQPAKPPRLMQVEGKKFIIKVQKIGTKYHLIPAFF